MRRMFLQSLLSSQRFYFFNFLFLLALHLAWGHAQTEVPCHRDVANGGLFCRDVGVVP